MPVSDRPCLYSPPFSEAMMQVSNDLRFVGIPLQADKERLFDEYLRARVRREREAEMEKRKKLQNEFQAFLSVC